MDIKAINRMVTDQFRAGGPVDDMDRSSMILLTTIGTKSGRHTPPRSASSIACWWSQTILESRTIRTGTSTYWPTKGDRRGGWRHL